MFLSCPAEAPALLQFSGLVEDPSMRRAIGIVPVLLMCVFPGCTPRDFLTRRLAGDLIAASAPFKSSQQFWLRTGLVSNKDFTSPEYMVLQHQGWIGGTESPCGAQLAPAPCWDVYFTPLGVGVFQDLVPKDPAKRQYFAVPVARRELVEVTGISRDNVTADVDFIWRWVPLNEVGKAMVAGDVRYKSTVTFKRYDDGWRLLETTPVHSSVGIDDALKNAEVAP